MATTSVVEPVNTSQWGWPAEAAHDLRRLAAVALAGAISGALVGGVGSRLAMMLIAANNRDLTGRLTDDGAVIGRLDFGSTGGLVAFCTVLGVLGGTVFLAVRDLRFGPQWFRIASMAVGPAVVVGNILVHRDGIDFTQMEPVVLSIAMFVAIPGLYVLLLAPLADRWLTSDAWPSRAPWWRVYAPLLLVAPILPIAVAVVLSWLGRQGVLAWEPTARIWSHPARAWVMRGALTVVFLAAAVDLMRDIVHLT